MLVKSATVVIISPILLIPGVFISLLGAACGQIYVKSQLSVKPEMSNARAPELGLFRAAVAKLTMQAILILQIHSCSPVSIASIRVYGAEKAFIEETYKRINKYTRAARTFYNLNR